MSDSRKTANNDPQIVLYTTADRNGEIDKETVWLTQSQMIELFGRDRSVITRPIRNLFKGCDWTKAQYVQKMHNPGTIPVGYRI